MVGPSKPEAGQVAALREALPAAGAGIYLDTPVAGPLPAETAAAMAEIAAWDLATGRVGRDRAEIVADRIDEARAAVAAIIRAEIDEVVLAGGLSAAFILALRSIDWHPGDAMAVADDPALDLLAELAPPGVAVERVPSGELDGALQRRPFRLLAMPMVDGRTGARLAVPRNAETAVLIEASLAVGAIDVHLAALGSAIVVGRSEAWLLGPEGLAFVVAPGLTQPRGGFHLPSVVGFARGCGWLSMNVGLPWVVERTGALTDRIADALATIAGVELLTPADRASTLAFRIAGWPVEAALEELGARVFLIASAAPGLDAIRIGVGFWNTEAELDRLADAVRLLAEHTPATLPRRPTLAILGQDR